MVNRAESSHGKRGISGGAIAGETLITCTPMHKLMKAGIIVAVLISLFLLGSLIYHYRTSRSYDRPTIPSPGGYSHRAKQVNLPEHQQAYLPRYPHLPHSEQQLPGPPPTAYPIEGTHFYTQNFTGQPTPRGPPKVRFGGVGVVRF
jgi:hypothetical protein